MHEYAPGPGRRRGEETGQPTGRAPARRPGAGDLQRLAGLPAPDMMALQGLAGNTAVGRAMAVQRHAPDAPRTAGRSGGRSGGAVPVQRALLVDQKDYTGEYRKQTAGLPEEEHGEVLEALSHQAITRLSEAIHKELPEDQREKFLNESERIIWQLKKAIVAPIGYKGEHPVLKGKVGAHPDFGAKNHDIKVNDYRELALNLMGWVYAKENRKQEKEVAKQVQQEGHVDVFLNVLLKRIYDMSRREMQDRSMGEEFTDEMMRKMDHELTTGLSDPNLQDLATDKQGNLLLDAQGKPFPDPRKSNAPVGAYLSHFAFNPKFDGTPLKSQLIQQGGLLELMKNPEKFSFRDKMIGLHDLSEYFGHSHHTPNTQGKRFVAEIDKVDSQSTTGFGPNGERLTDLHQESDRGQMTLKNPPGKVKAHQPSTRNEDSPTTKLARERNLPVWAGQSYTAARMFKLAKHSGASTEEIAAVAWGIFSFWRVNFDHTTEFAYHTLHEVMDIGQNFGVAYDMDKPYASREVPNVGRVHKQVVDLLAYVSSAYAAVDGEIRQIKERPDRMMVDTEEEFLSGAEQVREAVGEVEQYLRGRFAAFERWRGGNLPDEDKTALIKDCVSTVGVVHQRMQALSERLAALQQRFRAHG
ncbi:hypothetical protein [Streptomyces lancefieldiae]|uniref:Uncharacterized protein n=1 Tax=Streptomyces lancefieldiae TaxID=3075520 RepID=A0ABU3ARY2_9ACTN|nr:hypothetical protein [Streptomyces sp. DSM 40712]MDT0612938.1 hypothetical protein [Streptomyces sp. DSM 40712]